MNTIQNARKRPTQAVPPPVGGVYRLPGLRAPSDFAREARDPRADLIRLREEAAAEIDRLLSFLDSTEGDVDFENGDDEEPWLGFTETEGQIWPQDDRGLHLPSGQDLESECEDEGAECNDEGIDDTGIGDLDGLMEQRPDLYAGKDVGVLA